MARLAVRSETSTRLFVLQSGDDENVEDAIVRRDDRTCMNVEEITLTAYGAIVIGMIGTKKRQTLYPWSQIVWIDSEDGSELR